MVPGFPLLGLTPSGLFMGLSSTIIYTSELILCSTICVPSATRHNIHSDEINLQSKQGIICHVAKVKPATSAHYLADVIPFLVYVIFPSNPTLR